MCSEQTSHMSKDLNRRRSSGLGGEVVTEGNLARLVGIHSRDAR